MKEEEQQTKEISDNKDIPNPFIVNGDANLISERDILLRVEKILALRFGGNFLTKIHIRTQHTPGTLNEHFFDPVTNKVFLDSRNVGMPWEILEEGIHSISGGFSSFLLDEAYTNFLISEMAQEGILGKAKYYELLHYPQMQPVAQRLLDEVGEAPVVVSYFAGDERFLSHALGPNGDIVLTLIHSLSDFWVSIFDMFEVDVNKMTDLILKNRNSVKNLKLVAEILKLRYQYWKNQEFNEENKDKIFAEIERIKGQMEKVDSKQKPALRWGIFEKELRKLASSTRNPMLKRASNRLLSDLAMTTSEPKKGGIDLTPTNMRLQTQNAGQGDIQFHLDPEQLQRLQNAPGFAPVIINIQPLINLKEFLEQ